MTVNTESSKEFSIDSIVTMAYRQAGLANPYETIAEERKAHGRDMLEMAVKSLATHGLFAKTTSFEVVTLIASAKSYAMPDTVLNVVDRGKYIAPGEDVNAPTSEITVMPIGHVQWQDLSTRAVEAQPTQYYVDRSGSVPTVWVWPTPGATEAGGAIRFKVERLRANSTNGALTPDTESFWELALTYELAFHLAMGHALPDQRCQMLRIEANKQIESCKAKGRESVVAPLQIQLSNRWRARW